MKATWEDYCMTPSADVGLSFNKPTCRKVCGDDKCYGTLTNPIPWRQQWYSRPEQFTEKGCCLFKTGICDYCCDEPEKTDDGIVLPARTSGPKWTRGSPNCYPGYYDRTHGQAYYGGNCRNGCEGGPAWRDSECRCACMPLKLTEEVRLDRFPLLGLAAIGLLSILYYVLGQCVFRKQDYV